MAKKLFYKIGEACKRLDIQPYVLRYWETEFPFLKPNKSKSGQRVYSAEELAVIVRIKELLYEEGYTIAGAKKKLESDLAAGTSIEAAAGETATTKPAKKKAAPKAKSMAKKGRQTNVTKSHEATETAPPSNEIKGRLSRLETGLSSARQQARDILSLLDPP